MSVSLRARLSRAFPVVLFSSLLAAGALSASAAAIHGVVTDPSGARVAGARVVLVSQGKTVGSAASGSDGSYQLTTGIEGRFFLVISAPGFRQVETPDFFARTTDAVERNLVLEPDWVHESIVVTATGTPTPQPQTSESTSVLESMDLEHGDDLVSALRLTPGAVTVQSGQMGAQTSLFVCGGNSTANQVQLDGVNAGDMGGQFDLGVLSTSSVERVEVFRGANSSLYGADAGSSVISLRTPHGTTSFPSILARFDGGNFDTTRDEATVAGARRRIDYLTSYSLLQSGNALPRDEFHSSTWTGNLGWQPTAATQLRGTVHYGVSKVGLPNAWDFYHIADSSTEKDQDLFLSGVLDNQTTESLHNVLRYGATRKREQQYKWAPSGELVNNYDGFGDSAYMGQAVTITGANGASVTGQAQLDYPSNYADPAQAYTQLVNDRDQVIYQGDYRFTHHTAASVGFHYEDERGAEVIPVWGISEATERRNYDYLAVVHGDYRNRFFYTLGGSLEHYSLFGTATTPRAGLTYYAVKERKGFFSGTRMLFNFGDAVREPKLTDEFGSLYQYLLKNGGQSVVQALHITPLAAPTTRTYEGGVEQTLLGDHVKFRAVYFHNEFGRELESAMASEAAALVPGLSTQQQNSLQQFLTQSGAYSLMMNSQAFRAQGVEATVESGIGSNIFLRGGYTYSDAVVQHSFTSDNVALLGGYGFSYNGIPLGAEAPLAGARPFRRPPHTGYFTATFASRKLSGFFNSSFASRSDDSTFLDYMDSTGGSSLLLPNRNLDHGYARLDLGGSYQLKSWFNYFVQMDNLLSNQHMAPIGYVSLPFTVRTGVKFNLAWPGSK
jgi:iron complex outermembrane receptor protein/vitamin B12 transporter